jgi:hypothetical protein
VLARTICYSRCATRGLVSSFGPSARSPRTVRLVPRRVAKSFASCVSLSLWDCLRFVPKVLREEFLSAPIHSPTLWSPNRSFGGPLGVSIIVILKSADLLVSPSLLSPNRRTSLQLCCRLQAARHSSGSVVAFVRSLDLPVAPFVQDQGLFPAPSSLSSGH